MFKKILFSLLFFTLFLSDVGLARRRGGRPRHYSPHQRPYRRNRRFYYGPNRYWPGVITLATTAALLNTANKDKVEVIVVKRRFTDKELELVKRIDNLEKELKRSERQLKEAQERKEILPKNLKHKLRELETISKELKESLVEQ